jgi:SsrA-binding protein
MSGKKPGGGGGGEKIVCLNRKARHEYDILETLEGGLVLTGTEVKSLRQGQASIKEAHAIVKNGEIFLVDCHIPPYVFGNMNNHEPRRQRKVLLHGREIKRLTGKLAEKGLSLVPLRIYFRRGLAKVELALARGRKTRDKRNAIRERDVKREMDREARERVR